jgi:hypothetical protein
MSTGRRYQADYRKKTTETRYRYTIIHATREKPFSAGFYFFVQRGYAIVSLVSCPVDFPGTPVLSASEHRTTDAIFVIGTMAKPQHHARPWSLSVVSLILFYNTGVSVEDTRECEIPVCQATTAISV